MKIILLHGSSGSKRNFRYLIPLLKPHEIICFDIVGYGRALKPTTTYTRELFLQDIENNVRFDPKEKYVVIGHSLGAIFAKDLALRHKEIKRVIFINYPLDTKKILNHKMNPLFLRDSVWARLMCKSKFAWKYVTYPVLFLFYSQYFDSVQDYFNHSYEAEVGVLRHVVAQDDIGSIQKLKRKVLFIYGSNDIYYQKDLLAGYPLVLIGGMSHLFFGFEREIARVVKKELGEK